MSLIGLLQVALLFLVVLLATRPLGAYMARVCSGERTPLDPLLVPSERLIYRVIGVDWQRSVCARLVWLVHGPGG